MRRGNAGAFKIRPLRDAVHLNRCRATDVRERAESIGGVRGVAYRAAMAVTSPFVFVNDYVGYAVSRRAFGASHGRLWE